MASLLPATLLPEAPSSYDSYFIHLDATSLERLQDDFLTGQDCSVTFSALPQQQQQQQPSLKGLEWNGVLIAALSSSGSLKKILESRSQSNISSNDTIRALTVGKAAGQGRLCQLPSWLAKLKESSRFLRILTAAMESGPLDLAANKNGARVSSSVDFGIKRAGYSNKETSPLLIADRPKKGFFRSLTVVNEGFESLVLLDICGIPELGDVFIFHDDFNIAHHHKSGQEGQDSLKEGVTLQPGDEYQVTVELRCSPHECSFHQQWLLFALAKLSHTGRKSKNDVSVIGRQISAFVAKHVQDVHTCLSVEAKPFFPAILRTLFDRIPVNFSVAEPRPKLSFMEWPAVCIASKQATLSVWKVAVLQLEQALNLDMSNQYTVKRETNNHHYELFDEQCLDAPAPASPTEKDYCPCFVSKLRQLSRLLALEEEAMNHDIKDFDLFNVQLLYHSELLFGLEVPGLPENRPSVFIGDTVYLRWASYPSNECAAIIYGIESRPNPRLILRLTEVFLSIVHPFAFKGDPAALSELVQKERAHARFTFDKLMFKRMHAALGRVARFSLKLIPCSCTGNISNTNDHSHGHTTSTDSVNCFSKSKTMTGSLKLENQILNKEQQEAVQNILDGVSASHPYIIFGPPGTGKTVTVVECVLQVIKTIARAKVCVCAPSNYAADILCSGIAAGGLPASKMWRLNDPRRNIASVKADVLPFCRYNTNVGLFELHPDPSGLQVIVCTCGAAGFLHEHPLSKSVGQFTHVFVDEAGQALVPEVLIPLTLGSKNACRVLCGDPCQLGPVVHSKLAGMHGFSKSLLEDFMVSLSSKKSTREATIMTKLVRNYRANSKLLELPSRMFYNDELIAATKEDVSPPQDWEELNGNDFPILFYGVKGQQFQEGESPSLFNPVEATKLADLIEGLLKCRHVTIEDIGVMAPYRRQVQKIRLILRLRHLGAIRVGTVDDYQGQEERIIFISTVLTRSETVRSPDDRMEQQIGFIRNNKRFNVAITRAKAMLVIVGHPLVLLRDENWSKLLQYCLMRDAFHGYGSHLFPTSASYNISVFDPLMHESETTNYPEDLEMSRAIEKLAELSLLGMGDLDRVYPNTLDAMYSACNEDLEWRVML